MFITPSHSLRLSRRCCPYVLVSGHLSVLVTYTLKHTLFCLFVCKSSLTFLSTPNKTKNKIKGGEKPVRILPPSCPSPDSPSAFSLFLAAGAVNTLAYASTFTFSATFSGLWLDYLHSSLNERRCFPPLMSTISRLFPQALASCYRPGQTPQPRLSSSFKGCGLHDISFHN